MPMMIPDKIPMIDGSMPDIFEAHGLDRSNFYIFAIIQDVYRCPGCGGRAWRGHAPSWMSIPEYAEAVHSLHRAGLTERRDDGGTILYRLTDRALRFLDAEIGSCQHLRRVGPWPERSPALDPSASLDTTEYFPYLVASP